MSMDWNTSLSTNGPLSAPPQERSRYSVRTERPVALRGQTLLSAALTSMSVTKAPSASATFMYRPGTGLIHPTAKSSSASAISERFFPDKLTWCVENEIFNISAFAERIW